MSDISKLHRALKNVKYKENKPINLHKTLTLIVVLIFLGFGFVRLVNSPTVTALVVSDLEKANNCYFKFLELKLPFMKNPITCTYEGFKNGKTYINLNNNHFPEERKLFIRSISLNNCNTNVSEVLSKRGSLNITLPCEVTELNNNLYLEYDDLLSGLTHNLEGNLYIMNK